MKNGCEGAVGVPLWLRLEVADIPGRFTVGRVLPHGLVYGRVLPSVAAKETIPTMGNLSPFSHLPTMSDKLKDPFFLGLCVKEDVPTRI